MFDGSYAPIPRDDSSPSNMRSQETNTTPNDLSLQASGPGPAPASLQAASDATHFPLGPQHLLVPFFQGAFQNPLLQGGPNGIFNGGPSHELNNATATPSGTSGQGGDVPTNTPYGGQPTALPNIPSGQAGNPSASFQFAGQLWHDLHPDLFARPDAQGIPGPLWQLFDAAVAYQDDNDLRVLIHFKKIRSL